MYQGNMHAMVQQMQLLQQRLENQERRVETAEQRATDAEKRSSQSFRKANETAAAVQSQEALPKRPKLPDPVKFSGNRALYASFEEHLVGKSESMDFSSEVRM